MGEYRLGGRALEIRREIGIDPHDDGINRERPLRERRDDLTLAREAMRDVAANQLGGLVDRVAVPREDATRLQLQDSASANRDTATRCHRRLRESRPSRR